MKHMGYTCRAIIATQQIQLWHTCIHCIYICNYIYIYVQTHIHTYICTYTAGLWPGVQIPPSLSFCQIPLPFPSPRGSSSQLLQEVGSHPDPLEGILWPTFGVKCPLKWPRCVFKWPSASSNGQVAASSGNLGAKMVQHSPT